MLELLKCFHEKNETIIQGKERNETEINFLGYVW